MARPQNSPKGLIYKRSFGISDSSGNISTLASNSTGLTLTAGLQLSGLTAQKITANSTAIIASALRIGTLASYITANSTGIKLGSRYISTNTTGNATT